MAYSYSCPRPYSCPYTNPYPCPYLYLTPTPAFIITKINNNKRAGKTGRENDAAEGPPWGTRGQWPLLLGQKGHFRRLRLSHLREPHSTNSEWRTTRSADHCVQHFVCGPQPLVWLDLDCSRADSSGEKERVDGPASRSAAILSYPLLQ